MCHQRSEYELINPTTQIALSSNCIDNCPTIKTIRWNIYQGSMNFTSNQISWTQFNQMNKIWFYG
jgi:hypothetical protein